MRIRFMVLAMVAVSASAAGPLNFSNTTLLRPHGNSEPEISISSNGTMAMVGLQWLFDPSSFGTNLWTGPFGMTPQVQGVIDASLQQPGKSVFGAGDADVNIGSTGTLHATTLVFLFNAAFNRVQIGVSAIACPGVTSAGFSIAGCKKQIIDTAGTDRPWTTSDGTHVYISYHDSGNSSLIRLQRSDDDGLTWRKVGDPVVGQGSTTGNSTFNNEQGNVAADPLTHNVYDIYAAGQAGIQKGTSAAFNNIIVSRSTDMGVSWTANVVYTAPLFTSLNNLFPSLAVDSTTGELYATWSDGRLVYFSSSSDQGSHWSPAATINVSPANTAVFPWISAHGGIVDVVFYATDTTNTSAAVWNVYLVQSLNDGASFTQSKVSNTSNHTGVICTQGTACAAGTRNLLDLFQVAINPSNGLAAVIYTDDMLTVDSTGNRLPQVVLAIQQ